MCPGYPASGLWERTTDDDLESSAGHSQSEEDGIPFEAENIQPLASPLKHSHYYFDDGNVTLLVSLSLTL